jgi:hypothetical protein
MKCGVYLTNREVRLNVMENFQLQKYALLFTVYSGGKFVFNFQFQYLNIVPMLIIKQKHATYLVWFI